MRKSSASADFPATAGSRICGDSSDEASGEDTTSFSPWSLIMLDIERCFRQGLEVSRRLLGIRRKGFPTKEEAQEAFIATAAQQFLGGDPPGEVLNLPPPPKTNQDHTLPDQ